MTLAFGFSRFLNLRVNSSRNPIFSLLLASCSCSSSTASTSELPEIAGVPETIREGRAEIFADKSNSVFYNKAQVNNRDLSIAVLRWFILKRQEEHDIKLKGRHTEIPPEQHANELYPVKTALREESNPKPPKVLEALAASGLRAIRYALEVDGIGEVIAVDNNEVAIESCKKNIYHNGILASSKVVPHLDDARIYMLTHPKEFDVDRCWTAERLARHGLQHHPRCLLCDQEPETIQHLLLTCPATRQTWHEILAWLRMTAAAPSHEASLMEWWSKAKRDTPKKLQSALASAALLIPWMIWKHRNDCVFNGAQPSVASLAEKIKEELRLWARAGAKGLRVVLPSTWDVH